MSTFLNTAIALAAIAEHRSILEMFILEHLGRKGVHIVILDPAKDYTYLFNKGMRDFSANIVAEVSIFPEKWLKEKPYVEFARAKAYLAARERMNSGNVPRHRLRSGDVRLRGGVYDEFIPAGMSGLDSKDDESWMLKITTTCKEKSQENYATWKDRNPEEYFIP